MAKSKNFIIKLELYPFHVMVSIGEKDEDLKERLRDYGIPETELLYIEMKSETHGAKFNPFDCGVLLIRLRGFECTPENFSTLQHEIIHSVFWVFHSIGMQLELGVSDEAYTYLTGYLTKKIYQKLLPNTDKLKHPKS